MLRASCSKRFVHFLKPIFVRSEIELYLIVEIDCVTLDCSKNAEDANNLEWYAFFSRKRCCKMRTNGKQY